MNNFNLMMSNVEFPESVDWRDYHSYVANVFWHQKIGKVSKVSVMPYSKNDKLLYICLVTINEWFDSECAYNFIKRLQDPSRETRLVYSDDNWWVVELNNEISYQDIYTVNFKEAEYDFPENDLVNEVLHYVSDDDEFDDDEFDDDEFDDDEFDDDDLPTLERGEGNYWCASCGERQGGMYSSCYNVNCEWYKKSISDIAFGDKKDISSEKSVIYDDLPPILSRSDGNYWCSLCLQGTGGMYSSCNNVNCEWYKKIILDIGFDDDDKEDMSSKKSVRYDDLPPTFIPPESWLHDDIDDEKYDDDAPPSVIPPVSWLYDDIEFEDDEQEEWVKIVNEHQQLPNTMKYVCEFCGEAKRRTFSICGNCETYGNGIEDPYEKNDDPYEDIYDESFNYQKPKNMKNVTLRKHQKAYMW